MENNTHTEFPRLPTPAEAIAQERVWVAERDAARATIRVLAAELEILEQFDRARSYAGHDYGAGQRTKEIIRVDREITSLERRFNLDPIEKTCLTTGELVDAFRRISAPKVARLTAESYRRHTPATQRTLGVWNRLFDYWATKSREACTCPTGDYDERCEIHRNVRR